LRTLLNDPDEDHLRLNRLPIPCPTCDIESAEASGTRNEAAGLKRSVFGRLWILRTWRGAVGARGFRPLGSRDLTAALLRRAASPFGTTAEVGPDGLCESRRFVDFLTAVAR